MLEKTLRAMLAFIIIAQVLLMPLLVNATAMDLESETSDILEEERDTFRGLRETRRETRLEEDFSDAIPTKTNLPITFPPLNMPTGISSHRPNVYVNGFPVISIDFDVPVNWEVSVNYLQHIRDFWHDATLSVSNTSSEFELSNFSVTARGRGNSTWLGPWRYSGGNSTKRPLRFRFPNNQWQGMFDADYIGRDWILLANVHDPTHLRTFLPFTLGRELGNMHFTPNMWFVHLYLNGEYRGVYSLIDEREASVGRGNLTVNIDPTISEYMIELDGWLRYETNLVNTHWVNTNAGMFDIRHPSSGAWMDTPNNPHALYVENFVNRVDDAIRRGNQEEISSLIDVNSFVDFYLVQELLNNKDIGWSSVFFQIMGQNENRRMYAGPLWDFDVSSGSVASWDTPLDENNRLDSPTDRGVTSRNDWFMRLMRTPWFRNLVQERWLEIRDVETANAIERVVYLALTYEDDFQRDFDRWQLAEESIHVRRRGSENYLNEVEHLHWWLIERINWMTDFFEAEPAPWRVAINNGVGAGAFATGTEVHIEASNLSGYQFSHWEVEPININIDDKFSEITTFEMPAQHITINAIFEPASVNRPDLTVIDGLGTGSFAEGSIVLIYSPRREGYDFVRWESSIPVEFVDVNNRNTSIIMPSEDVTIRAIFEKNTTRTLTVTDGFGTRNFEIGETAIAYAPARAGHRFVRWEVTGMNANQIAYFNPYHHNPMFIMPDRNLTIRAIYEPAPSLTVTDGFGTGNFAAGSTVIAYAPMRIGYRFVRWEVTGMNANQIAYFNPYHRNPMFIMPNRNVEIRAIYEPVRSLTVSGGGLGTGNFASGSTVIAYARPRVGHRFVRWEVTGMNANQIAYFNPYHHNPMFIMPDRDIEIRAIFESNWIRIN